MKPIQLNTNDTGFAVNLAKALGMKNGDTLQVMTPQFERVDGRKVTYFPTTPKEYEALKKLSPEDLKKVGCQVWEKVDSKTLWLFPYEWYNVIPDGTKVYSIMWKEKVFKRGESDDDMRGGALAYGFIQA